LYVSSKVAGQNPEILTGIEIETYQNPSKPIKTCYQNLLKPIETHQNLSKLKGFNFCQNGIRVLPHNLSQWWSLYLRRRRRLDKFTKVWYDDNC